MKIVLLNVEQAQSIYRSQMVRDFPESELKPFASVQGMMTRGLYEPIHGSAPDIAGQDKADPQSMRSAIYAAIDIVEHRRAWAEWSRNPLQRAEREKGGRDVSVKDLPQTEKED